MSIPLRICASRFGASLLTRSPSAPRSTLSNCYTFATEPFGKPVTLAGRTTFPGASAQRRLLVRGTHAAVEIRPQLKASPWTMTTGRRARIPDHLSRISDHMRD